jgi:hypothetical protein
LLVGGRVVAKVVPDGTYPHMWRIDLGGALSDVVNLPRAKDAAVRLVDASLDITKPMRRASPVREMTSTLARVPDAPELAPAVLP